MVPSSAPQKECLHSSICARGWGSSATCVSAFACLYACVLLCVLTYVNPDARRLSLEMLVSSVVVLARDCRFWTVFPAGSPIRLLMGLPRVDATCAGCQKVKVPYSSAERLQFWGGIVTHLSLSAQGGAGSVGARGLGHFLKRKKNPQETEKQRLYSERICVHVGFCFLPLTRSINQQTDAPQPSTVRICITKPQIREHGKGSDPSANRDCNGCFPVASYCLHWKQQFGFGYF